MSEAAAALTPPEVEALTRKFADWLDQLRPVERAVMLIALARPASAEDDVAGHGTGVTYPSLLTVNLQAGDYASKLQFQIQTANSDYQRATTTASSTESAYNDVLRRLASNIG